MKFLSSLLFVGTLLANRLGDNVGPKIWSEDLTKAHQRLDANSGMEGRIVGGEQAGMKDAPWQVITFIKYSPTPPHSISQSVSSGEITMAITGVVEELPGEHLPLLRRLDH